MRSFFLILFLASWLGCSGNHRVDAGDVARPLDQRIANLERAAALPWADDGHCAVREASNEWPLLVERCFDALDRHKIRFNDTQERCAVASTDAATLSRVVGICLLIQPEIAVGAVIIIGTVVVAAAIAEELDERARCKKVAAYCREKCSDKLPTPDNGFSFWNCLNSCMEERGCHPSVK